ncbi:RNA recognition motif containing protein [Musa troglodytarum]|uniref:RNA recognition motif containing protein n=1 Tax=Musa troglodytarum TaxID=320322 RepID=A0A9E7EM61_9LILI|nr:RNA recognition motif containing protein [Musa troglodytarum]
MGQQFGDTTLTKVFVGGLAWETQKDALREHFEKYGEILEAVIISDKATGRSKGYGFVTFKQAEAAKKACEDATPVISGRRANCNLASLGAKRGGLRPSPPSATAPLPSEGHHQPPWMAVGARAVSSGPPAAQWYYRHPSVTPPPPSQFHLHHGLLPLYASTAAYGYAPDSTPQSYENYRTSIVLPIKSPAQSHGLSASDTYSHNYMTDLGYNAKLSQGHFQGQLSCYPAQGGMAAPNGLLPMYHPFYHLHHHQSPGMGVPAHFFPPAASAATGAVATIPTIISKPAAIPPPSAEWQRDVHGDSHHSIADRQNILVSVS